jgi:hypothetical protein
MMISEAHSKLRHIHHAAVKHAIANGLITCIELDPNLKLEFYEPCAKAKAARQPFPMESQTQATKYSEQVH